MNTRVQNVSNIIERLNESKSLSNLKIKTVNKGWSSLGKYLKTVDDYDNKTLYWNLSGDDNLECVDITKGSGYKLKQEIVKIEHNYKPDKIQWGELSDGGIYIKLL